MPYLTEDTRVAGLMKMTPINLLRPGDPVWYWNNNRGRFEVRELSVRPARVSEAKRHDKVGVIKARMHVSLAADGELSWSSVQANILLLAGCKVWVGEEKHYRAIPSSYMPSVLNMPLLTFARSMFNAGTLGQDRHLHSKRRTRWTHFPQRLAEREEGRDRLAKPPNPYRFRRNGKRADCRPTVIRMEKLPPAKPGAVITDQGTPVSKGSPYRRYEGRVYLGDKQVLRVNHGIVLFDGPVLAGDKE